MLFVDGCVGGGGEFRGTPKRRVFSLRIQCLRPPLVYLWGNGTHSRNCDCSVEIPPPERRNAGTPFLTHVSITAMLRRGFETDEVNESFLIYLILAAALGPEVYSDSRRNEYQNQKK
jgi:hypothetical protein